MEMNLKSLIDEMHEGVYFTDLDRRITYWNRAAEQITGFPASEVIGTHCSNNILIHVNEQGKSLCHGMCPLAQSIGDGATREARVYLHHKEGHRIPVLVRVSPLKDASGNIIGGAELFTEVTEREPLAARVRELEKLVLLDPLTRLSNRRHVESALSRLLHEKMRYGLSFGVLFLDLDHFKAVNDNYGHDVGDTVLKTVAATLSKCARPYDLFGRWGGEEFVGLIRNTQGGALKAVGERCRQLIAHTHIHLPQGSLQVTASAGGTLARKDDYLQSLISRADKAMYTSKEQGRDRLTII